jgi:hypothetical protein
MFIKDWVMWRHYNIILENSDITTRPWQRLAISDNLNLLSAYVIWNILVLSIKGKVSKIAIIDLDFDRTRWSLLQKRALRIQLDIYFFIPSLIFFNYIVENSLLTSLDVDKSTSNIQYRKPVVYLGFSVVISFAWTFPGVQPNW